MPINKEMGDLLWRRIYDARKEGDAHVSPMLAITLESLLKQAGIPEPMDEFDKEVAQFCEELGVVRPSPDAPMNEINSFASHFATWKREKEDANSQKITDLERTRESEEFLSSASEGSSQTSA